MGTQLYMAPEQLLGARDVDAKADVYALGVVWHQLLTGTLPGGVLVNGAYLPDPAKLGKGANVPEPWAKILRGMVQKDPAKRSSSVEVAKAIENTHARVEAEARELLDPSKFPESDLVDIIRQANNQEVDLEIFKNDLNDPDSESVKWVSDAKKHDSWKYPENINNIIKYFNSELSKLGITYKTELSRKQAWMAKCGQDAFGTWATAVVGGIEVKFRYCPPGRFLMGSPESEQGRFVDEGPQHEVELSRGFWLGETPVTQAVWEGVMGVNPSEFKGSNRPVENVSWDDCSGFLGRANARSPGLALRLPTEAEWEYACRAGTTGPTYRGKNDAGTLDAIGWYKDNSGGTTQPVKQKAPNPWGLYDTLGNVWEWCSDWRGDYTAKSAKDPTGPETDRWRVYRGGSWGNGAERLRAAIRNAGTPVYRYGRLGFRLARGQ